MLVRRSPFAEWVVVYFSPEKTNEKKILSMIRNGGCANSSLIRSDENDTAMNPYLAAGDMTQLKVVLTKAETLSLKNLPKGWILSTSLKKALPAGTHFLNIRTPKGAKKKVYDLEVASDKSKPRKFRVEIVSLVE